MTHLAHFTTIALIVMAGCQIAAAAPAAPLATKVDARWHSLPDTRTSFVPKHYNTREEWEARREELRKQLLWSAGLWPIPERTPLAARIFDRIDRGDYTVEKVSFQSAHGLFVCGNLYRPKNPSPRGHPGILNPHGHAKTGRLHDNDIASYQARCITYARMGCVAFMWDMVGYNDSAMQLNGKYEDETYVGVHKSSWNQRRERRTLWNINSLGIQLWNSIRALDFLESLPEVDPHRLASTGESGGGTQTFLLGAVDERLKVAAPVCMVSAFMQGGCTCENAPGLRYDTHNVEYGAMMAPRPMMLVSVSQDWTQHTETVELPAIRAVYKALGAESRLAHAHFDARHGYNLDMRNAVYPWMAKEVSVQIPATFKEPPYQPEKNEDLLAFERAVPDAAVRDHETLVDRIITHARTPWQRSSRDQRIWNRPAENRVVYGEGLRLSVGMRSIGRGDISYEREASIVWEGFSGERGVLTGPRGVRIPIRMFAPARPNNAKASSCSLLVDGEGSEALSSRKGLIRDLLAAGQTVYAIDVFGVGLARPPADLPVQRGVAQYFLTFNRSDDAERICDIVSAISFCRWRGATGEIPGMIAVAGFGKAGPWVTVAGAVLGVSKAGESPPRFAVDVNGFNSDDERRYLDDLFIPGVLRAGGLANAAALIHPQPLLLYNTRNVFDASPASTVYGLSSGGVKPATLEVYADAGSEHTLAQFMTK